MAGGDRAVTERQRLARIPWRQLTSRPVYENRWIRVREDQVELPDGRTTLYGVVQCAGCVGVLPFLDPDTIILVGQYRYVAGDFYWEMPTGAMKPGESEEAAVQRELAEEAGYEAGRLVKLCACHTSKSVVDETANIYLADGLRAAAGINDSFVNDPWRRRCHSPPKFRTASARNHLKYRTSVVQRAVGTRIAL